MKRHICAKATPQEGLQSAAGHPAFSRIGPKGVPASRALIEKLAQAMGAHEPRPGESHGILPGSMILLGRLIDHDLTFDRMLPETGAHPASKGRMPALDLDGIYGHGRRAPCGMRLREDAGYRLGLATVSGVSVPGSDADTAFARLRLAFARFHNRLADRLEVEMPREDVFEAVRRRVTRHYQRTLRLRFLPAIVDRAILEDVFRQGRRHFETPISVQLSPTTRALPIPVDDRMAIPVEFSVAAYGLVYGLSRGGGQAPPNTAVDHTPVFANLARGNLLELASGQQMADLFGVPRLSEGEILESRRGIDLDRLPPALRLTGAQRSELARNTPLWFYVLREAEVNGGLLGEVGGRIVAEVFHRAMEVSRCSIVRETD